MNPESFLASGVYFIPPFLLYLKARTLLRPPLPADWDDVRDEAMHKVVYAKFSKNENLRQILLSTEDEELVEDTTGWHDNIWGDCSCPKCQYIKGRNKLGKILMQVRDEIKTGKMQHP